LHAAQRLKLLKSDEQSLRATISELVTATDIAERAIGGLKLTVEECEVGLASRIASAERLTADIERRIASGKDLLERLAHPAAAEGKGGERPHAVAGQRRTEMHAPPHDVQAVAAAAQAFAERLRVKVHGLAA
jgi:hypothetical protein